MGKSRIFRQASLDRLASPEQLDEVIAVTSPRGWLALLAIGILLASALTWGIIGSLADNVAGRGILVRSGGVLEVVSPAAGRVTDVAVSTGDSVSEGQVVARIAQPDIFDRLQELRSRLEAERGRHEEMVHFVQADVRLQLRGIEQRRMNLDRTIEADQTSLASLAERIEVQERLVQQGLMTRTSLLATRQQYEGVSQRIRTNEGQKADLEVERLSVENHAEESLRSGRLQVEQLTEEVGQLERQYRTASEIVSPYTGRILEVMVEQGRIVGRGEAVLSLDRTGEDVQDLVAVVYVPSVHGKMVHPGMIIHVSPSTVRQEEFGMMVGRVTFVSSFPATPKGMLRVLKNEQLVRELSGGGAPYEVHAELAVDPTTESQYRWTSSGGPPTRIQSGTTALATVTVAEQRPISKVLPLLRKWTGT